MVTAALALSCLRIWRERTVRYSQGAGALLPRVGEKERNPGPAMLRDDGEFPLGSPVRSQMPSFPRLLRKISPHLPWFLDMPCSGAELVPDETNL